VNVNDIPATAWRKSQRSNADGNCIEVAAWRKSQRSNGSGSCVEVAALAEGARVSIRDSKDPQGAALTVRPADWRGLTGRIKAGLLG
jgi:Domain of unknown function (DUF397)